MNIYIDFLSKKDFGLNKYGELSLIIKNGSEKSLFEKCWIWVECKVREQDSLLNEVVKYFKNYTNFAEIAYFPEEEGFWVRPYFADGTTGGKFRYLSDLITAEYVINNNSGGAEEQILRAMLPYLNYESFYIDLELRKSFSYWLNVKEDSYLKVRKLFLENRGKRNIFQGLAESSKLIKIVEDLKVTHEGFPYIDKIQLYESLKKNYESY